MNIFANVLEAWRVARADRSFEVTGDPARRGKALAAIATMTNVDIASDLATRALAFAIQAIGLGEEGGNNRGPFVERCIAPAKPPQNWCAGLVGWCYERAAEELGMAIPFARSLGAKRLGRNIAAVGRRFTDPAEARPGDVMVFHRGATGSWQGHIAIVERNDFLSRKIATIEGNAGPKVMRRTRYVDRDRFAFFASLRR